MACISFETYVVDKVNYQSNSKFTSENKEGKLHVPVKFSAEVGVDKEIKKSYVLIDIDLGTVENESEVSSVPFFCQVSVRGLFSYDGLDDDELKIMLGNNAVAILYPYVRSYISNLVNLSNQFPAYTLPVMNFAEMLKDNDLVNFVGFD